MKIRLLNVLLCVLVVVIVSPKCDQKLGCLSREKFFSYVSYKGPQGQARPDLSKANYKIIYVYEDKLVFYTAKSIGSPVAEEEEEIGLQEDLARIERIVNFEETLLECGSYFNSFCTAGSYKAVQNFESFKKVKRPDGSELTACFVIPFFENAYPNFGDKVAYICGTTSDEIYKVLKFKHFLSRQIEMQQMRVSADRYNPYLGLIFQKSPLDGFVRGAKKSYTASITGKKLILSELGKETSGDTLIYSFYQQAKTDENVYILSKAITKGVIDQNTLATLYPNADPETCIFFKGVPSPDTQVIENDKMVCIPDDVQNKPLVTLQIYQTLRMVMKGIKLNDATERLIKNPKRLNDCTDKEYRLIIMRTMNSLKWLLSNDCKMLANNVSDKADNKYPVCETIYDEMIKLTAKQLSLGNESVYNQINNCVYADADLSSKYINKNNKEKTIKQILNHITPDILNDIDPNQDPDEQESVPIDTSSPQEGASAQATSFVEMESNTNMYEMRAPENLSKNYRINPPIEGEMTQSQKEKADSFRRQAMAALWKAQKGGNGKKIAALSTMNVSLDKEQPIDPLAGPPDAFVDWLGRASSNALKLNKEYINYLYRKLSLPDK